VENPDSADLIILNTCHIREKAAEKVYSDIGRIKKIIEKRPFPSENNTIIGIAGCVAQAEGAEMMRRAPIVDLVFGPQTYHRLPELLVEVSKQRKISGSARVLDTAFSEEEKFDLLPVEARVSSPSAFLTIQEGCDKFCTYCVVPYTRGAEFSRSVEEIIEEAKRLVAGGAVELTLLGQNVNAFHGKICDGDDLGLGALIRVLANIDGLERIRYTTSHPSDMEDSLLEAHRDVPECMPYLHLPVQSGSDKILKAMNRNHTSESYKKTIRKLREINPEIALSGDFIVGFPGETDEDFEKTMQLVREVKYSQAYSFKYSPRPGTPASVMENQVEENIKSKRLQILQEELNRQQLAFNEKSVGKTLPILMERQGKQKGQVIGRSPYMHAVYVNTLNNSVEKGSGVLQGHDLFGKICDVKIVEAGPNSLRGELV
jgi:tRNA-2-methylthio-N6-dimethylallyladenosine synthase